MSHTKELVEEALDKVEKYLEEKYVTEDLTIAGIHRTGINHYLEILGFHITRTREWNRIKQLITTTPEFLWKLSAFQVLTSALKNPECFDQIYEMLQDQASKETLDWFIRYRVAYAFLAEEAYNIYICPITKEDWDCMLSGLEKIDSKTYKIDNILIEDSPADILSDFIVQQYTYGDIVKPNNGDIAVDVGAYVGDTSLWLGKMVGPNGSVYAFEPEKENFRKLINNVKRNDERNIKFYNLGLSDTEMNASIWSAGGMSSVSSQGGKEEIVLTTLDKFVYSNKIERIDFIKMDVEGHEMNVLRGAQETIKTFKPKLAICVYHRGDDLLTIPDFLKQMNPGYQLYLRHCRPTFEETVLYAIDSN